MQRVVEFDQQSLEIACVAETFGLRNSRPAYLGLVLVTCTALSNKARMTSPLVLVDPGAYWIEGGSRNQSQEPP